MVLIRATANLDSFCARQHRRSAGRDEETAFRSNKETDEGKDAPTCRLLKRLLDKSPYKETAGRGAAGRVRRYGDFGADEERGRACWEAVDVVGEFVLSIGVGRSSIGSGDRSTRRFRGGATARIVIAGREPAKQKCNTGMSPQADLIMMYRA